MISVFRVCIVYMAIRSASAMYVTIRMMGFPGKYHKKSNESVYVTSFISAIRHFFSPLSFFAPLFPRQAPPSYLSPHHSLPHVFSSHSSTFLSFLAYFSFLLFTSSSSIRIFFSPLFPCPHVLPPVPLLWRIVRETLQKSKRMKADG